MLPPHPKAVINPRLNPNNTFRNFKVSAPNKEAVKAGRAFVNGRNRKGQLLLTGPTGSGKTHLVNAIGNAIKANRPDSAVLYVSGEELKYTYFNTIKSGKGLTDFRKFYLDLDVLILDNLQDLKKAPGTQEIFFRIIDHLNQEGKRLLFTSSCSFDELKSIFDERTVEHLSWGQIVEIGKVE